MAEQPITRKPVEEDKTRETPIRMIGTALAVGVLVFLAGFPVSTFGQEPPEQDMPEQDMPGQEGGELPSGEGENGGVRIKEIAEIQGVRTNQLVGFGIVTGLKGTGDSSRSKMMKKLISNFASSFDVDIEEESVESKNSAVVMVTGDTPPFLRSGQRIDVTVSSLQDARSLSGGILLQTPLKGANGKVYAIAQGNVVDSGGENGTETVGQVVEGALVEREIISRYEEGDNGFSLLLKRPDFSTAYAVYEEINSNFPELTTIPVDASKIQVIMPEDDPMQRMEIISQIENLRVTPDSAGKVVINSDSGVVVMGTSVRIGPVSVSYDTADLDVGPFTPSGDDQDGGSFLLESTTSVG
ncbi:MAG: flagellar basal body P-ring protein FlgI, partial [Spirochaetia bacterium]